MSSLSAHLIPHGGCLGLGVEGVSSVTVVVFGVGPEAAALVAVLRPQDGAVLPTPEAHLLHH